MASVNKEKNRYPGIRPFAEEDISLFFGREKDSDDLTRKIFIKQVVVLYGKSGYGKSSLINAGIIPELKKNDEWIYFPIRFNNYSEKESGLNFSPVQTVKQRFSENIKANLNAEFSRLLPDEDSFWYWIKQNQLLTKKNKFIIFFDQFEELFTYSKDEVANFSELLSELLYGVVPNAYRKRLEELNQKGSAVDLYDFIYDKPEVKVVFSIRSDRLSQMNVLTDRHPTILQYCYELDALSTEDAIQAITGPAKINEPGFKSPTFEYDELAVAKIIIASPIRLIIKLNQLRFKLFAAMLKMYWCWSTEIH